MNSFEQLLSINTIKKKDITNTAEYLDQTRNIVLPNNEFTYPLISITNRSNIISECVYLGNYFLTILPYEIYTSFIKTKINYKLCHKGGEENIIDIISNSNPVENKYFIVLFNISNTPEDLFRFKLLSSDNYLNLEKVGNLMYTFKNYTNKVTTIIRNISRTMIICDTFLNMNLGTPLFIENELIGIFYKKTDSVSYFFRISAIESWFIQYNLKENNLPYVSFTNEQLYSIIVSLQNRIEYLESK
jgi:hypothetical protein